MHTGTQHDLAARLHRLEAHDAARATLAHYLELCDVPQPELDWNEMATLFTEDAVWEGLGSAYDGKFGRLLGRAALLQMLAGFLPPEAHFASNVHLLSAGRLETRADATTGRWVMQQVSTYETGRTELILARLHVDFAIDAAPAGVRAVITHFRTEKLSATELDPAQADRVTTTMNARRS